MISYIHNMMKNKISILPYATVYNRPGIPIYIIQLPHGGAKKLKNKSWKNETEALFIRDQILSNLDSSISTGIVAMYKAHAQYSNFINRVMNKSDVMAYTVDSFQGKEKDCIILSLVTNVINEGTQFNNDAKRINVALTRCKKALIVVVSFDVLKAFSRYHNANDTCC
eukprot:268602_1